MVSALIKYPWLNGKDCAFCELYLYFFFVKLYKFFVWTLITSSCRPRLKINVRSTVVCCLLQFFFFRKKKYLPNYERMFWSANKAIMTEEGRPIARNRSHGGWEGISNFFFFWYRQEHREPNVDYIRILAPLHFQFNDKNHMFWYRTSENRNNLQIPL